MIKKNFWPKLRSNILKRRQPFTTLHWRFVLPGQERGVKVHRYVFSHTYKDFSFILRILAFTYNLSRWWLYFAWIDIFQAYKYSSKICLEKNDTAKHKQLVDLFTLAFAYCIPPLEYYQMRLYRWPHSSWLNFAYDFQAMNWHSAFSYSNAKKGQDLVNDKKDFESYLIKHDFPTIKSLLTINSGVEITQDQLDKLPIESFFKPTVGNRCIGCFSLRKDTSIMHDANLRFIWFKDATEAPYKDIKDLNRVISHRDYLIQPILINHPEFTRQFETEKLATVRLVTAFFNNQCEALSAVLETATPNKPMYYWNVVIDLNTGQFMEPVNDFFIENEEFSAWFEKLKGKQCPKWQDLKTLCLNVHQNLPELLTIGWDIALTIDGPIIVEGNVSWGLKQYQQLIQKPLLETSFGDLYSEFITRNSIN